MRGERAPREDVVVGDSGIHPFPCSSCATSEGTAGETEREDRFRCNASQLAQQLSSRPPLYHVHRPVKLGDYARVECTFVSRHCRNSL